MGTPPSSAQRPAANEDVTSSAKSSAKPAARFGNETVSAAVFREERTTKKGETFDAFNVSLRRSYRKPDGSFGTTHTLQSANLTAAIEALQKCQEFIENAREGDDE